AVDTSGQTDRVRLPSTIGHRNPMLSSLVEAWRRRWWRPDPVALAAFADLKPMTVVTGASEGIGYALACRFAAAGSDLILVSRRPQLLKEAADRIGARYN